MCLPFTIIVNYPFSRIHICSSFTIIVLSDYFTKVYTFFVCSNFLSCTCIFIEQFLWVFAQGTPWFPVYQFLFVVICVRDMLILLTFINLYTRITRTLRCKAITICEGKIPYLSNHEFILSYCLVLWKGWHNILIFIFQHTIHNVYKPTHKLFLCIA